MPKSSAIARLQGTVAIALLVAAVACWAWLRDSAPAGAVLAAIAVAFVHAWVLALEFVLLRLASRSDPTPAPTISQLAMAWFQEVVHSIRIFGWRQPFAWREEPDHPEVGTEGRVGIVFIHGFVCNRGFWTPWLLEARRRGHPFIAVNLEPVFGSIDEYPAIVEAAVARLTASTGRPPALVCHSMGGLVARAWLRECGGAQRVAHVVTIGTPHQGTWLARFSRRHSGLQMRVGSDWLAGLLAQEPRCPERFTCWYSNCDNIVFPPLTATVPGADNRFLPAAAHVDMAFRPKLVADTFDRLAAL